MTDRSREVASVLASAVVGAVVAWGVGVLPWWRAGLELPISSAWPSVPPEGGPRVTLPFGEYQVALLLAVTWVGATVAVALPVALPGALPARAVLRPWGCALGAVLGLGAALVQSVRVVTSVLASGDDARLVLTVLIGAGVLGTAAGLATGWALVGRHAVPAGLGLAATAVVATTWASALVVGGAPASISDTQRWLLQHDWVITGVVLGAGLAVLGLRPWVRLVWWPIAGILTAVGLAALTALQYAASYARAGSGGSARAELVDATADVFRAAVAPDAQRWQTYVLALAIGLVVGLLRWRREARRR